MAEKITQRQMFVMIKDRCADDPAIVEFCDTKIKQLDKRKTTARKPSPEVQERRDNVYNYLMDVDSAIVKDIADALGYSSSQVTGAIRGLVNAGMVESMESEKKSSPKQYRVVASVNVADDTNTTDATEF